MLIHKSHIMKYSYYTVKSGINVIVQTQGKVNHFSTKENPMMTIFAEG